LNPNNNQDITTSSAALLGRHPPRFSTAVYRFKQPKDLAPLKFRSDGRKFLTFDQVGAFLEFLEATGRDRLIPYIALQALAGLRIMEMLRLDFTENLNLSEPSIIVEGQVKNTHSLRKIPIPDLLADILAEHQLGIDEHRKFGTRHSYYHALDRALRAWMKPRPIEPKGLRRTISCEADLGGWAGVAVERYLGHAPRSVREAHYTAEGDQLYEMMSSLVVRRINEKMADYCEKRHEKRHDRKVVTLKAVA